MPEINPSAAVRISGSQLTGPILLKIFQDMADFMDLHNMPGSYHQFQFIGSPEELKPGDLIPEIHLSLRPYEQPLLLDDGEFKVQE